MARRIVAGYSFHAAFVYVLCRIMLFCEWLEAEKTGAVQKSRIGKTVARRVSTHSCLHAFHKGLERPSIAIVRSFAIAVLVEG